MSVIDSALLQIRQLQPYTPGKPVEELERELGIANAVKLASNENPLGCSPRVSQAIAAACKNIALYPDANAYYLKRQLAQKLAIKADQITIGNGSNDVLDLVARSFLDAGSEAIYSEYAFLVYPLVIQACGASAKVAAAKSFGHDLDAMLELINPKTRLIFIANPNNPTGTWLKRDELHHFLQKVPADVAVVIDEAYFEYVDEADYPDSLQWLEHFPNLIVTRTFSKIYGLAGLRIGYAVSSAGLCDLFNRVRQPFNGNALALSAAMAALDDEDFVQQSRANNLQGLVFLRGWCEQKGIEYIPSVGNFLSVSFADSCTQVCQSLMQRGVITRPIANYGMADYLRISIGTPAQLDRLVQALDDIL